MILFVMVLSSCTKNGTTTSSAGGDTTVIPPPAPFDINSIEDTYDDVASFTYYTKWGSYNVHDPSVKKFGDYYYCYSTDVGYATTVPPGIQVRKSKDLVQWQFSGWVFNGLPAMGAQFISSAGGTPNNALWAPYVLKVGNEYRLYYALSSATARLSVIGLATAASPDGPWTEKGLVVTSKNDNTTQTNAIDPTVVTTPTGDQYLYYGSAWDGIYILKLDATTGLAAIAGDKGTRIANRGFTNNVYNGNIEGAEIIYNPTLKKYFLFIAYDWLQTKYNVRVCKADNPQGPFYDYNGHDANLNEDHTPMILAPYQFAGHGGWQGTAHCGVFTDDNGQYYMAHQGRPGVNSYCMDLHVRKIFWTNDGWPVVSPERYAWEDNSLVPKDSLAGNWEQVVLNYRVVPGYANEQVSPDLQVATSITLSANGSFNNEAGSTWTYNAPWLTIQRSSGETDQVFVQKGRDWENKKSTLIFTGLNNTGTAIWGKKK
ncbi:putative endo-arabinase [Russula earlei]|uniref:Endo-arabinase n=1 Tax=Russula earlei TaxID=71964 RepID=A0ACC0TYJ7_9AGAM|nr:putative endo-arabinase [Russula earlei]